ncbi:hypothetical protein PMAYCL1PPCAC_09514, partial [Pristionchus mayeri]
SVKKGKEDELDKKWIVTCHPPRVPLPTEVCKGAMLEIMDTEMGQPRVTSALMLTHSKSKNKPIENWELISAIYGKRGNNDHPVVELGPSRVYFANNKGSCMLNPQQTEAVERYCSGTSPAFVVEAPPSSGKTMTSAAMAVNYKGPGVQLFLSTANVPVINMDLALAKLDIGSLKPIHFISSEREELMTEETRSPFTAMSLAKKCEHLNEEITFLERQLKYAPNDEEREKLRAAIRKVSLHVYAEKYDIFFATVDMILGRLFKSNQAGKHQVDHIKKQLMTGVRRIVVDEASQLTEAALNAIIL